MKLSKIYKSILLCGIVGVTANIFVGCSNDEDKSVEFAKKILILHSTEQKLFTSEGFIPHNVYYYGNKIVIPGVNTLKNKDTICNKNIRVENRTVNIICDEKLLTAIIK